MRSDTLLSLDEFCLWAGADPWAAAQVDRANEKIKDGDLKVAVQFPWQTIANANDATPAEGNSRDSIVQAMRRSESLFLRLAKRYPAPQQILNEEHLFPSQFEMRHGYKFRPKLRHLERFGIETWTEQEKGVTVTQLGSGELLETFSITLTVPDDTVANSLHAFLPNEAALLKNEIRPLDVSVDSSGGAVNWTATLTGPAYLFVKPEHYTKQRPEPVSFEKDNCTKDYLQTVDIYLSSIDIGQQGFYSSPAPCNTLPCPDPTTVGVCWSKVGQGDWVFGEPASYDGSTWTRENLIRYPSSISMNYIAGYPRIGQRMAEQTKNIIAMLTAAFLGLEDNPSDETVFMTAKVTYFAAIQSWQSKSDFIAPQQGYTAMLAIPEQLQAALNGLEPRRGIVQAYQQMMSLGWIA